MASSSILLNGQPTSVVNVKDRGLQYGDGFFTTMRVLGGEPELWPRHQARLRETAQQLGFEQPDCPLLLSEVQQLCGTDDAAIRITLTRGAGGRGYASPKNRQYTRVVARTPLPSHYSQWRETGICLGLSQQRLALQPMIGGLKTLNRLEQVLLKQELAKQTQQPLADDLVVLDAADYVCETTAANLFWRRGNTWYTSDLKQSGVRGVVRGQLLADNAVALGRFPLAHLQQAEQAFVCNALMGLVPVHTLMGRVLPRVEPFPNQLTTRLNEGR